MEQFVGYKMIERKQEILTLLFSLFSTANLTGGVLNDDHGNIDGIAPSINLRGNRFLLMISPEREVSEYMLYKNQANFDPRIPYVFKRDFHFLLVDGRSRT